MLKSREQILQARLGSINESVFKIGDIYNVKTVIEVPKSLINAFVSKAKKEHDVDPRESWSDTDLAELFVKYVTVNFMNIDSIPVDAIMGEKDNRAKSDSSIIVTDTTTEEPLQQTTDITASTETPIENQEEPKTQEETRIANIPTELQVESKVNENNEDEKSIVTFALKNIDDEDEVNQKIILDMIGIEPNTYNNIIDGYNDNIRNDAINIVHNLYYDEIDTFNTLYDFLKSNNYITESKVNESSHTDFIMNYSDELKDAVEKMKSIQSVEIKDEEKLKELEQKAAPIMAIYDKNVERFIFNGDASVDGIVRIGFDNQNRYGTEPQFIIDAIDSLYHIYVRLGLLEYKSTDEKMETFLVNATLTDKLKDYLNENHIEYDQSSGILEIKTTKKKLKNIKAII